jgi:hypothetical protein
MLRVWLNMRLLAVAAIAAVACGCATSEPRPDLELEVGGDEIRLELSEAVARSAVEGILGSRLECDGEIDDGLREVLAELDRGGARSRATRRDGESTLDARRRGGQLDLEIRGSGPGKIEASMPWAVAQCLLGRSTTVDRAVSSSIEVKVKNPDGRDFSFRIQ